MEPQPPARMVVPWALRNMGDHKYPLTRHVRDVSDVSSQTILQDCGQHNFCIAFGRELSQLLGWVGNALGSSCEGHDDAGGETKVAVLRES